MMIFGREPTEEELAEMERERDEAIMKQDAFNNEIDQWIESLTPRQTFLFKAILNACNHDSEYIMRQIGRADGRMKYKYNVDPASGLPEGMDFFADAEVDKGQTPEGES